MCITWRWGMGDPANFSRSSGHWDGALQIGDIGEHPTQQPGPTSQSNNSAQYHNSTTWPYNPTQPPNPTTQPYNPTQQPNPTTQPNNPALQPNPATQPKLRLQLSVSHPHACLGRPSLKLAIGVTVLFWRVSAHLTAMGAQDEESPLCWRC